MRSGPTASTCSGRNNARNDDVYVNGYIETVLVYLDRLCYLENDYTVNANVRVREQSLCHAKWAILIKERRIIKHL